MPRILRNLRINEVSGVDRGAGHGVKIMLMKRDGQPDEKAALDALGKSIESILADETVTDKVGAIDTSITEFNEFIGAQETEMTPEQIQALIADAVKPIQAAHAAELEKRDTELSLIKMSDKARAYHDGLKDEEAKKKFRAKSPQEQDDEAAEADEADAKKRDVADPVAKALKAVQDENVELRKMLGGLIGEKRSADFRKRAEALGLIKEDDGEIMRKAFDGDVEAQVVLEKRIDEERKALKAQVKTNVLFAEFGKGDTGKVSVMQQFEALAADLRKREPKLTKEQAFARVYTDPANRDLIALEKAEQGGRLAQIAAGTGQS